LEGARLEFEIELLKRKIRRWEVVEVKLSFPLIKAIANFSGRKLREEIDWSREGVKER
jgi:hypothetical protein